MDLAPGHLVRVPFATRRLRGVVVASVIPRTWTTPSPSARSSRMSRCSRPHASSLPAGSPTTTWPPHSTRSCRCCRRGCGGRSRTYVQLKDAPEQQDEERLSRGARPPAHLPPCASGAASGEQAERHAGHVDAERDSSARGGRGGSRNPARPDAATASYPAGAGADARATPRCPASVRCEPSARDETRRLAERVGTYAKGIGATDARKRYGPAAVAAVVAAGLASFRKSPAERSPSAVSAAADGRPTARA